MTRWMDWLVVAGVLAPWVGMIIILVVQSHLADRVGVLEHEVTVLKETTQILIKDLGWKQE